MGAKSDKADTLCMRDDPVTGAAGVEGDDSPLGWSKWYSSSRNARSKASI